MRKALLDNVPEGNGMSSQAIFDIVAEVAHGQGRRGHKVLESDGIGIALMLESMSKPDAGDYVEDERRALIISNFTRDNEQKKLLARIILEGKLLLPSGLKLPTECYDDLFVIVYHHDCVRIMWRGVSADANSGGSADADSDGSADADSDGSANADSDGSAAPAPAHDAHEVLDAIRKTVLFDSCRQADKKKGIAANFQEEGQLKYFDSKHVDITEVYTALHEYARRKRRSTPFKLKTVVLSGELGGRGIAYKTTLLQGHDKPLVRPHNGYLTDMFYMFDAVKNRRITQHGEQSLQNLGRLCGLTTDEFLSKMARGKTPPRLWTSSSCYNVIKIFGCCVDQWVQVMQMKQANETMLDAVVRCIRGEPARFKELDLVYRQPTTDRRWAKKDAMLRQSRLIRQEKHTADTVRDAISPRVFSIDFGIDHNPDNDAAQAIDEAIAKAEAKNGAVNANNKRQRVHDFNQELLNWRKKAIEMLQDENMHHDIQEKTRKRYMELLWTAVTNKWIESLKDVQDATAERIEQAMHAKPGTSQPKNAKKHANDIASALHYATKRVPADPAACSGPDMVVAAEKEAEEALVEAKMCETADPLPVGPGKWQGSTIFSADASATSSH